MRPAALASFRREESGASAVEFAIVAIPTIWLLLGICQVGLYYFTQSSLDAGVTTTAENLRNSFNTATPTFPNAATLKANVVSNAGGLVANDASLAVELRQLTALTSASVAVTDGVVDYGATTSVLVLRAETSVLAFAPGFSGLLKVRSSGMARRQGR